jgi:hypothetical protein
MSRHRSFPTLINQAAAGIMLIGTLTPLHARDDDPLQPIIQAIERDRKNACPNSGILSRDKKLEVLAQEYARHEDKKFTMPPGYNRLHPYLGAGDPEAQAINRTYQHGAGDIIGNCGEFAYGVGFFRHDDRSVDVVTMVFGELTPPNHPASIRLKPGQGSFYISGSGFSQSSTVSITYNYFPGRGVTTNTDSPSKVKVDPKGSFATIVYVSTLNAPGRLDVEAKDSGGLSTTKTIQF